MANLPTRTTASFDAIKPVSSLVLLDNEFNQYVGAAGILNGGTTGAKLLIKTSDGADPPVDCDQIGAGLLARWKQNGSTKVSIANNGDLSANGITGAAGVYTFGAIPVGPASDPTTANQLARKAYVDGKKTVFTASFGIADPSSPTVGAVIPGAVKIVAPGPVTITEVTVTYETASHAPGTAVTFGLQRRTAGAAWTDPTTVATVPLDGTNNAPFLVWPGTISPNPFSLAFHDTLMMFIFNRSGAVTERDVTVSISGFQTVS